MDARGARGLIRSTATPLLPITRLKLCTYSLFYPLSRLYVLPLLQNEKIPAPKFLDRGKTICNIAEMSTEKLCFGDGENQGAHTAAISDFSKDEKREDHLSVYCRVCAATRQRAWKKANPEKVRAAKRLYRARQKENLCSE